MKQTPAAAQISPLQQGDIVTLNSGGQKMTIDHISDGMPPHTRCMWHKADGEMRIAFISLEALKRFELKEPNAALVEALRNVCAIESLNPAIVAARNLLASLEQV